VWHAQDLISERAFEFIVTLSALLPELPQRLSSMGEYRRTIAAIATSRITVFTWRRCRIFVPTRRFRRPLELGIPADHLVWARYAHDPWKGQHFLLELSRA